MPMDGKGLAASIIAKKPMLSSEPAMGDDEPEMGLRDAAQEVMDAVKSGDVSMLMDALKSFCEQCSNADTGGEY